MRRAAVVVAAALAALAACGGDDDSAEPATTTATGAAPAGEALELGDHDAVRIEVASPDWLAADEGFVYVRRDSGDIDRIDAATGAVIDSIATGTEHCQGIGVGFDSVWTCDGTDVVRADFATGEVVATIAAGKAADQGHLATGFDRVWVLQGDGSALVAIDPATNELGTPVTLPVRGTHLAVDDDGIWIVSALDAAVLEVDPADGTVRHRLDGFEEPRGLSVGDDVVWVGDGATVVGIDPASGETVTTIDGGIGRSGSVTADGTGVWVRRAEVVRHVDGSGTETESLTLPLDGPSPGDVLVAFGALWTSASEHGALFRIDLA